METILNTKFFDQLRIARRISMNNQVNFFLKTQIFSLLLERDSVHSDNN